MKNENVIKMARLMVGCTDRTCEDCLSQSKKLFGDNKCALIEYAEVLDKAGYRKQSDTVKEFAEKIKKALEKYRLENEEFINGQWIINASILCAEFTNGILDEIAASFGKED